MYKKTAILQSNYIPWKGYFDLINSVDEFILFDEVQYTKNDWRNRNLIKTGQGLQWLSIPVKQTSLHTQRVCDTQVANAVWRKKHWQSLVTNYSKAPCFKNFSEPFKALYLGQTTSELSQINYQFITAINNILNIKTKLSWSSDYTLAAGKTARLVKLCQDSSAQEYISGPSAKNYIEADLFAQANIKLTWMDYAGYPEYPQLHPPFQHTVSILDLIFNVGADAPAYMHSFHSA
ncbi:MAG: WbqC family protein [Methylococcales bacterium]